MYSYYVRPFPRLVCVLIVGGKERDLSRNLASNAPLLLQDGWLETSTERRYYVIIIALIIA